MKFRLIQIGKTEEEYLKKGISDYENRLKHYISFSVETITKNLKSANIDEQKKKEGAEILNMVSPSEFLILLDERGEEYSSSAWAKYLQQRMNSGLNVTFVIGGAYGFSDEIYKRANHKMALSQMTFTHQMVRLLFVEQFYRSMTIIKGEKYHH